jgi:glycosyltransferase involved in cell wall biosynthesis
MAKKISIIIPVYNEEKFIERTLTAVLKADTGRLEKELIVIDDGSKDRSVEVIKAYSKKSKKGVIRFIAKQKNEGKGAALKTGLQESTGDIVLIQDADLEYNPEDYPLLIEPFERNDADVVYGSRFISNRPHRVLYFWHYLINMFLTMFSNALTNLNLTDMETGYKVFRGDLIRKIAPQLQTKRFGFEPEITARISNVKGIKIYEVGISYAGRTYEEGKKITWLDGLLALWEIFKYNLLVK